MFGRFPRSNREPRLGTTRFRPQLEALETRELLTIGPSQYLDPNQLFLAQLYSDLLHRNIDKSGILYWTNQMAAGTGRDQIVQQIESSLEYRTDLVQNLYLKYLARPADANGLGHFVANLANGSTSNDVTLALLDSDEYYQSRAGGSASTFVAALYHDVLGRRVDPTAIQLFVTPLASGLSRDAVVRPVLNSVEAAQRQLEFLYERFLFRSADAYGMDQFVQSLQEGTPLEAIIVAIASSTEYYARVAGETNPTPASTNSYRPVIQKLYQQFLDRTASPPEAAYWVGRWNTILDNGQQNSTFLLEFLNSPESLQTYVAGWFQHYLGSNSSIGELKGSSSVAPAVNSLIHGADFSTVLSSLLASGVFYGLAGGTTAGFVTKLYTSILERQSTTQELNDAVTQLGMETRQQFAQQLSETDEAVRTLVAHWYVDYLGRSQTVADLKGSTDIHFWTSQLKQYRDPFAVLSEFLVSSEYFGFSPDLYARPNTGWAPPPGPFAQPAPIQRGDQSTFHTGQPVLTTTYFYWYDVNSGSNVVNSDGSSAITHHPPTLDGFSYLNIDWHEQQLRDMTAAGIDVALPVSYSWPFSDPNVNDPATIDPSLLFTDRGLPLMVTARHRLLAEGVNAPLLGMFYDTTSLSGGSYNPQGYHVDLRTYGGKEWFYESIRNFFSHVPAADWARIDGKALVFLYHLGYALGLDENLTAFVHARFLQDFGVDCYLVAPDETLAPGIPFSPASQPWVDELHREQAFPVLGDMLASDQFYGAAGGTDAGFIDRLYDKILMRPADSYGKSIWLSMLQRSSRRDVIQRFLNSDEALRMTVAGWYSHYLRRLNPLPVIAASQEIDAWVTRLSQGEDPQSVLAAILASPEFYAASGNSDAALVYNLYQQALLRSPDSAGQAAWLGLLRQVPREQMIGEFLHTDEAYQVLVAGWLRYDLGNYYPGRVDAQYTWGGAISAQFRDVASFGPGYDQSAAKSRTPLVVSRDDGKLYQQNWETLLAMNPHPWLVHIETWNEFIEGSDIAETKEFGRLYINLTRQYADRFHGK